jgi:hypothetical protein
MKAIILSHTNLPEGHEEIHRFTFELHEGGAKAPLTENISLRTARVIVSHLEDGNALIQMLRALVTADPEDYEKLVGAEYQDNFIENGPSDRSPDINLGWQNAEK